MYFLISIAALILTAANGIPETGMPASIREFPWQVTIEDSDSDQVICDGAMVSKNWVLTTSKCVDFDSPRNRLKVRAGTDSRGEGGSVHDVDKIVKHEGYNPMNPIPLNNIALVRVKKPFEVDHTRRPVPLADQLSLGMTRPNVSGFSWLEEGRDSKRLRYIQAPTLDTRSCNEVLRAKGEAELPKGYFCAGYLGYDKLTNPCWDDLGDPLVLDGRLGGLVAYVYTCNLRPYHPVLYTDVVYYKQWINQHVG